MEEILKNYLDQIKIGGKQAYKNLALFPILSNMAIPLEYLTLDEALAGGLVEVTEKDLGGSVPELQLVNKASQMVLILDGEELVGGQAEPDRQHYHPCPGWDNPGHPSQLCGAGAVVLQ